MKTRETGGRIVIHRLVGFATLCLLAASCGGGDRASSNAPQVSDLRANPQPASLNVPVTFTVSCTSTLGASATDLSYEWHFGDETSSNAVTVTSAPTTVHEYKLPSGTAGVATYDAYQYFAVCVDKSVQPPASAQTANQTLQVLRQDLTTLASASCSSGVAGMGWCWQNPLPTGSDLTSVAAVSASVAWIAGISGTILQTLDGGSHWQPKYLHVIAANAPDFLTIKAKDANNAWAIATDGTFWSTVDGGLTWSARKPASALSLTAVTSPDVTHAWGIAGGSGLLTTANGGANWSASNIVGLTADAQVTAIAALDDSNLFAVGSMGGGAFEVETSTGGMQWTNPISLTPPPEAISALVPASVSVTTGSRCGNTDSLSTAETVWVGTRYDIILPPYFDASAPASATYSWPRVSKVSGVARINFGQLVSAFDGKTAWAYDYGGIAATRDDFATWTLVPVWFNSSAALDSADCVNGWAVGALGGILHTNDSAVDWTAQSLSSYQPHFVAVAAASGSRAVALALDVPIAGGGGVPVINFNVLMTTDGTTWEQIRSDALGVSPAGAGEPAAIATDGAGDIVIGGPSYLVIYANGTWSANLAFAIVDPPAYAPSYNADFSSIAINGRLAWLLDSDHNQLWLDDLSTNVPFASVPHASIPNYSTESVAATDAAHAVVVGLQPAILLASYAQGAWHWISVNAPTSQPLHAVAFGATSGAKGSGWIVGDGGTILRSTDGGYSWSAQNWSDPLVRFTSVSTLDGMEAWAVGGGTRTVAESDNPNQTVAVPFGIVIHTDDGGATWKQSISGVTPSSLGMCCVAAASQSTAWLLGPYSSIRKTVTGGLVPIPPSN
jgi:photosystem II stability/assembly factor-like uncharacterized protein